MWCERHTPPPGARMWRLETLISTRIRPVGIASSITQNTACKAPFNGAVSFNVTYDGSAITDFSGYTFAVLNPSGRSAPSTPTLSALPTGVAVMSITHKGCQGYANAVIPDGTVGPVLGSANSTITNSTSCDEAAAPSGALRVRPDGVADGAGYTYVWYEEPYSLTATPVAGATSPTRSMLRSGTHSVKVENETTGCVSTQDFLINLMPGTVPSSAASITEVTNCNPHNGGISVSLVGGAAVGDYDWMWFKGLDDSEVLSAAPGGVTLSTPGQASGLPPGSYTYRYRAQATHCLSELFNASVPTSATVEPVVETSNPSLAGDCRGAEGVARVTVNGPVGRRFDIRVYTGSITDFSTATATESSDDQGVGGTNYDLPSGLYTARVIERTSRCEQVETVSVGYLNSPTVVSVRDVGASNCAPYLGSSGNGGAGGASGWVRVTLEVDGSGALDHDDYQLFLYAASDLSSPAQANPLPNMTVGSMEWRVAEGRPRSVQSLDGEETGGGAGASGTPTTPATRGSVGSAATMNAAGRMERDYVFIGLSGNLDASIDNYVLLAAEEGQASCFSDPLSFRIARDNDEIEIPASGGVSITGNSSCGPANTATGGITVETINRGSDPTHNTPALLQANYNFEWFEGGTTSSPGLGTNFGTPTAEVASGLPSGVYTLRVTKTTNTDGDELRCSNTFVYAVNNVRQTIQITQLSPTHETSCGTAMGALEVEEVNIGGTATMFSAVTAPIEISVFNASNVGQGTITPSSTTLSGLGPGVYTLEPRNTTTRCAGTRLQGTIEDRRVSPEVNVASTALEANTSCTSGSFTGSIDLALGAGVSPTDFSYSWKLLLPPSAGSVQPREESINSMNPLSNGAVVSGFTTKNVTGLAPGSYRVNITHSMSSCMAEYNFAVSNGVVIPQLSLSAGDVTPNSSCDASNPNGRIVVPASNARPSGVNYNLAIYDVNPSDPMNPLVFRSRQALDLSASPPPSMLQFNNLGTGRYFLQLENPATGCNSPREHQDVLERQKIPQIGSLAVIDDKGCNGTGLGVGAVDASIIIPPGNTDTFEARIGTGPFSAPSSAAVIPRFSGLSAGTQTLTIRNTNNMCSSMNRVTIGLEEPEFRIERLENTDQSNCNPNGSVRVSALRFNGTTLAQAAGAPSVYGDYTFTWTRRDGSSVTSSTPYEINRLEADTYNVTIAHTASTCQVMASFNVEDRIVRPLLRIMLAEVDRSCQATPLDMGMATGVLVATADNRDDVYDGNGDGSPDYSFNWYEGTSVSGTGRGNTARVEGLEGGQTYTLEVRSAISGCVSTQEAQVRSRPIQPIINLSTQVSYTGVTRCSAPNREPFDGALRVSGVSPGALADYNVRFYDNDPGASPAPAPLQTVTNGSVSFSNLESKSYYLVLEHKTLGCLSSVYELVPPSEVVLPDVLLASYTPQTHCDPMRTNGGMVVTATNGSRDLSLYSFDWLNERMETIAADVTEKNDLPAGTYTIRVTLRSSGCQSSRDFILPDAAINPLSVSFQTSENLRCVEPYSGTIIASIDRILSDKEPTDYGFYWIQGAGTPTSVNAENRTAAWEMRQGGVYTVVAYDMEDPMCASLPTQVVLADNTVAPNPIIEQIVPLTACTPERANAELLVSFPNDPDQLRFHSYEWFKDNIDGESLGITPELINVGLGTYVVLVTNKASGCSDTLMYTIEPAYRYPEVPFVSVERSRTDCAMPNGIARVIPRRGTTEDYSYEWFHQRDPSTLVDNRARADTLDVGIYNIFLTEYATGCRSQQAVSVEIFNAVSKKRFNLNITPSLCTLPTGTVQIIPVDPFTIATIEWTHQGSGEVFDAESIGEAPPGQYNVTALDEENCRLDTSFVIPNIVKPYNGLSPNGDGLNDAFHIDCIDNYTGNTVSIYDRQGNPVFIQQGYDNTDNAFKGIGNTGIYVGNKKLPDGTYYFVIEANGLEQPLSGYLELIQ